MKELLVRTNNREALDRTLQTFGALVADNPEPDGTYAVRVFPPNDMKLDFIEFACRNQGYAEVVGKREIGESRYERLRERVDFRCHVCGVQCDSAPDPPARAVCPACCEDHDYRYKRELRGTYCLHCGQQAPDDWFDID